MKHELEELYRGGFFKNRHRLAWRAPIVCDAIIDHFNPASIIDCGAAVGDLVAYFCGKGIDAFGIEGSPAALDFAMCAKECLLICDLREPFFHRSQKVDLVTCFEVAEHIEPEFVYIFFDNLKRLSDKILMSAAPPGQKGHGHFCCQPYEFWEDIAKMKGYRRIQRVEQFFKDRWEPYKKKAGIRAFYNNLLYFEKA